LFTMLNKINIIPDRKKFIVYVVLTIVTLAVFWQVHQFDFINVDDTIFISETSPIRFGFTLEGFRWALSTTSSEFWHPLTWLSFMLDYQIYGLNTGGFHMTNVILHILSTLLLFWLFNRMTGEIWKSAFVAAFFALHPLRVESVAWVAERKDVLSAFFWMLTLCLYVYYTEKPAIRRYLLVLFSFVCGLMSKSMVVTLPIIMIFLDYWPLGRFQSKKGVLILWQLKEKIPLIILSAIFSIIQVAISNPIYPDVNKIYSRGSRFFNASVNFVTYLEKIFYPHDMNLFQPFVIQLPVWQISGSLLLILVISAFVIVTVKHFPYLFVGWLWYAISLLPVLGFFGSVYFMHEHYTYLPSIGVGIMMAWGIPVLFPSSNMRQKILFPAGITALAILAVISWRDCGYWKNALSLYSHTLRVTKYKYLACYNRGNTYAKLGKYQLAIEDYNKAIHDIPNIAGLYVNDIPNVAGLYFNRGIIYVKLQQYQQAIKDFNETIRLKDNDADAYNNRAIAYFNQGNKKQYCIDAKKACELGKCRLLDAFRSKRFCL
jgi:protein O-mannosyl-transferase